jgi:syndecan 1
VRHPTVQRHQPTPTPPTPPRKPTVQRRSNPTTFTSAPPTGTDTKTEPQPEPENVPEQPPLDLDAMARRLIEPVARLLRTELRRGRERAGRPHDGRR